ncbi:AraC family transcriptional regulator [Novosphingobium sp.]|uniref:AraC family transcriptional regulator n=1 Tax=Novosphingobium sp. TaxID=1874826 RepID=UPI003BABEE30
MDPMSDILRLLQPSSYGLRGLDAAGPWAIAFPPAPGLKCYALQSGACWLQCEHAAIRLEAGDLALVSGAERFSLQTARVPAVDAIALFGATPPGETAVVGGGGEVRGLGGFFKFAGGQAERMLAALPPVIHLRAGSGADDLQWPITRLMRELRSPQPGGDLIAQHLAQTLLIEALRLHLASPDQRGVGWLYALGDPRLRPALAALHAEPGRRWTLAMLAAVAGMSRTSFAERFRSVVGETPIDYLTRWRMLLAADRLRQDPAPIAGIAAEFGYGSESAFGAAFKRVIGKSPVRYVQQLRQAA